MVSTQAKRGKHTDLCAVEPGADAVGTGATGATGGPHRRVATIGD